MDKMKRLSMISTAQGKLYLEKI